MQRLVLLVILASLLAGCFSPGGPSNTMPTTPDEYFTGEPTTVEVTVISEGHNVVSLMSAQAESNTHTLVIGTPIRNEAGYPFTTKFTTLEIEEHEHVVSMAFDDVPSARNHDFTAVRYKDDRLIEFGRAESDAPVGMLTEVDIHMMPPSYDLYIDEKIPSGSMVLAHVQIIAHNPDSNKVPMLYGNVYLGLKPWNQNGSEGLWAANKTGEGWITDLAKTSREYDEIFFADVNEPKKLYYQVSTCIGGGFLPKYIVDKLPCVYEPDVESGETLPYVWLVPAESAD